MSPSDGYSMTEKTLENLYFQQEVSKERAYRTQIPLSFHQIVSIYSLYLERQWDIVDKNIHYAKG
jgi:hypothetical protein